MAVSRNLAGQRFGQLLVLERDTAKHKRTQWFCICDCGRVTSVLTTNLVQGYTKSCGQHQITHGHTIGGIRTPTYSTWHAMHTRCKNPNAINYADYGGRGIQVCERWGVYENFLADMGEKPANRSIDRYPDPDGNYEPGNCRWATSSEQQLNKRKKHL